MNKKTMLAIALLTAAFAEPTLANECQQTKGKHDPMKGLEWYAVEGKTGNCVQGCPAQVIELYKNRTADQLEVITQSEGAIMFAHNKRKSFMVFFKGEERCIKSAKYVFGDGEKPE